MRLAITVLMSCAPAALLAQPAAYDVVVVGGTPAGVAAAIASARAGLSVALVEETPVLGGLLASGVQRADDAVVESNSGVFETFRRRVREFHLKNYANDPVVQTHMKTRPTRWNVAEGQAWEPKVCDRVYRSMVAEFASIRPVFRQVPVESIVEGNRVTGVVTRDAAGQRHRYQGKIVIDATYEADVAAFAGVPFRVGREARSPEEPHAGEIYTDAFCEGAYTLPGAILPGSTGKADHKIQAYNFRFVVKDYGRPDGPHRLKTPPPGYDALNYKWNPNSEYSKPFLPNGKLDVLGINWGNDLAGENYGYPEATWEQRAPIIERYRNYALGWLYFIQTEGGSPNLGLADDEFTDNGNFPYKIYVRQGRRIEGLYRLTESDLHKDLRGNGLRGPLQPDSVATGIYEMDSHNVSPPKDRNSRCSGEGAINLKDATGPYQIPYGVLVPKNRDGLLVAVGISATHVAMSSVRMEPVWSALGEAAGAAAALAIRAGVAPREISVARLQEELIAHNAKLTFFADVDQDSAHFKAVQALSVLGALDGDDKYRFHADRPISKGDLAQMLVRGLGIPISITAAHFADAPRGHAAYRYLETLYDASSMSGRPFLDIETRDPLGYPQLKVHRAFVNPGHPVDAAQFNRLLAGALRHRTGATLDDAAMLARYGGGARARGLVTRGEAAMAVAAARAGLR